MDVLIMNPQKQAYCHNNFHKETALKIKMNFNGKVITSNYGIQNIWEILTFSCINSFQESPWSLIENGWLTRLCHGEMQTQFLLSNVSLIGLIVLEGWYLYVQIKSWGPFPIGENNADFLKRLSFHLLFRTLPMLDCLV